MVETDAMPSALLGDRLTLTIGKKLTGNTSSLIKGGFFTMKSRLLKKGGTKEEPIARVLLILLY
jgi:predicted glycoside hydrolase/deacetylase ChbG (UPF0249 family)